MHDLRLAFRALRRSPGLSLIAILSLAFGIGGSTLVFSVANAILLRPLPYREPERLVFVTNAWEGNDQAELSPAEAFDYEEQLTTVESLGFYATAEVNVTGGETPERARAAYVSHGVLPALGVPPAIGRMFTREENFPGRDDAALLSHAFWTRRYGGDPGVLGSTIRVDGAPRRIVGVMPASFVFPDDLDEDERSALILPIGIDRAAIEFRGSHFLDGVARLRDGVDREAAAAEIARIAESFETLYPGDYPPDMRFTATMTPLRDELVGSARPLVVLLLAAVGFVLLIACANVANLLLVRADSRRRELAVRTAIGARRHHLVRQFLCEGGLLAAAGGALGILLTLTAIRLVPALLPPGVPLPGPIAIDWTVLAFTFLLVAATTVVTGLVPALQASGIHVSDALRAEGRSTAGVRRARFRSGLVMLEIAAAVVLSLGAGLLLRTLGALHGVDPGFRTEGVMTFRVSLPERGYESEGDIVRFYQRLIGELSVIPGVRAAGAVTNLPLGTRLGDLNFQIEGREVPDGERSPRGDWQVVTPGYFDALGMGILRGRGIEVRDDANAQGVIVLGESLAARYWPGKDPLGQRLTLGGEAGPGVVTVIGIARDIRHTNLEEPPTAQMYLAHAQFRFWHGGTAARTMTVALRADGDPAAAFPAAVRVVREIDPALPLSQVAPLAQVRAESVAQPRFVATMFAAFSAVALIMAAIGVYGVLAFLVAQRTREIGIRMALGADRRRILALVTTAALRLTVPGVAIGLLVSLAMSGALSRFLFGVEPADPATFAGVALVLAAVALAAGFLPAARATRVEPTVALRQE